MFFLSWTRPSRENQKACLQKASSFNYDSKYKGATARSVHSLNQDNNLSEEGYSLNHARVLIGSGKSTYEKGKNALQNWNHFQMNWTFVDPTTPIKSGEKFCVCVKEFLPWLMMPLRVVYVNENKGKGKSSFSFGSGTLQGHLLAGEERFSIEMDEDSRVWYEILSISKPAHFLSVVGYPYVKLRQKHFAKESMNAVLKHVSAEHEVVGEVVEVGSQVTKFKVGDRVGVGLIVQCCRNCHPCKSEEEQYCNKKIWSYNDVYTDGKPTQGGFASHTVVDQKFVVKIPEGMASEQAAPLLCAGVTIYSPLKHFGLNKSGLKGSILGLGGVGHMGVKMAKAMGHHVVVISSSDKKRVEALDDLGANDYVVSSNEEKMKELSDSLDYIIDTIPVKHPLEPYLPLLRMNGTLILNGVIGEPLQFLAPMLMLGRKSITGTFIGSMKEMKEMLQFCNEKNLTSQIETVKMDYINKAMERLEKNDVRYRFVVDVAGSNLNV